MPEDGLDTHYVIGYSVHLDLLWPRSSIYLQNVSCHESRQSETIFVSSHLKYASEDFWQRVVHILIETKSIVNVLS